MKTLLALILVTFTICAFAADPLDTAAPVTAPALDTGAPLPATNAPPDAVSKFIVDAAKSHPWILTVLAVLGIAARLVQPTIDYLHKFVKETPTTKDDEFLAKVEASTVLKWVNKILSYCTGINLIHPDKR